MCRRTGGTMGVWARAAALLLLGCAAGWVALPVALGAIRQGPVPAAAPGRHTMPDAGGAVEMSAACELGAGSCCEPGGNDSPGCQDVPCCDVVCGLEPGCCSERWSAACAGLALLVCDVCCIDDGDCSDGNQCTVDTCDPLLSECTHTPALKGRPCEADGNLCTVDHCDGSGNCETIADVGQTCQEPLPPCEGGALCNPATGLCEPIPDAPRNTPCESDADLCTMEHCDGQGECVLWDVMTCASDCPLCGDTCDPATGLCPCVQALQSGDWSADIWGLEGLNPYPDNILGVPGLGVVIEGGVDVFLDVTAEIQSMCILDDGILRVTQGGTLLPEGSLTLVGPEGIYLENGTLYVADGQTIDSNGPLVVSVGGQFSADPDAIGEVSAALSVTEATIQEGPAGQVGTVRLTDSMSLHATGSVTLNGGDVGDKKGGCTPPDLDVLDAAQMTVGGDVQIIKAAAITYTSKEPLVLGGDFVNHSVYSDIFDWEGGVLLSPSAGEALAGPAQVVEAAGEDRGSCLTGFIDNYALGSLEIAAGGVVHVIDAFDNQQDGKTGCDEALYVSELMVGKGAVLNTDGCRVYYVNLTNAGSIPELGTDVLSITLADLDADCVVGAADLGLLLGDWGQCTQPCSSFCPADFNHDCVVNAADLAVLLGTWGSDN